MSDNSVGEVSLDVELDLDGLKTSIAQAGEKIQKGMTTAFEKAGERCKSACNGVEKAVEEAGNSVKKEASETQKKIAAILENSDSSMKAKASKIAWIYRKEGMSASDAMKKAWSEIERNGKKSAKNIEESVDGIDKQVKKTKKSVGNLSDSFDGFASIAKKIGAALAAAFAVDKISSFVSNCLELGSDLQEVQNVVDVTFTQMSDQVNQFAQSAAASFGLSETMAKKYAGTFGAMAKSFGFGEESAYEMSTALTGLAGDVASFYNITQDEAYTKLKSVFTGETESLKDLGVVMTQSALDAYALSNGFGKTTAQMSEAEKVALRFQFVTEKLNGAAGDFERTSDGWANQMRILKLQSESVKATLGQGFINAFTPAIKVINAMLSKTQALANAFKSLTELMTGKESSAAADAAKALAQAESSATGIQEAVEETGKALAGFDKLNNISGSTSAAAENVVPEVPSTPDSDISDSDIADSPMVKWLDCVIQKCEPTQKALKSLYDNSMKPLFEFHADGAVSFYEKFLMPVGDWALGEGLPKLTASLENLTADIDWDRLSDAAGKLFDAFSKFTTGFGSGLLSFFESASKFVGNKLGNYLDGVASAIDWMCDNVSPEELEALGTALGGMAVGYAAFKVSSGVPGWIKDMGSAISSSLKSLSGLSLSGGIGIITGLAGALYALDKYADANFMREYKEGIKETIQGIEDAINSYDADMRALEVDYTYISGLLDDYYNLSQMDFASLTAEEKQKLEEYYKTVSEYCPNIAEAVDSVTGAYRGTREELEKLIENQYKMYAIEAGRSTLQDFTKKSIELDVDFSINKQEFENAKQKLLNIWSSGLADIPDVGIEALENLRYEDAVNDINALKKAIGSVSGLLEHSGQEAYTAYSKMEEYAKGGAAIATEQEELSKKIALVKTSIEEMQKELQNAGGSLDDYKNAGAVAAKEMPESFDKIRKSISDSMDENIAKSDKFISAIGGMSGALKGFEKLALEKTKDVSKSVSDMASNVSDAISGIASAFSGIGGARISASVVPKLEWGNINIPHLAGGGFVRANTPQLAMIGDNRHQGEVVAPEGKLEELLERAVASQGGKKETLEMMALMRDMLYTLERISEKDTTATIKSSDVYKAWESENTARKKRTGRAYT